MKKEKTLGPKRSELLDLLITQFAIEKLGYDFMGYVLEKGTRLSYHHIIPVSNGGEDSLENGCPLCMNTSHPYIHVVQRYDLKLFQDISEEIRRMKEKGHIDYENLIAIDQMLTYFEEQFDGEYNIKNHLIVRPEFKVRIQKFIR